jgi:hypothetical protein
LKDVETVGLQMILKLFDLRLETQANTTLHVHMYYSTVQHMELQAEGNDTNWAGRYLVNIEVHSVAKFLFHW